ncbi:MAG: protease pro-enzyme activation domain-containing protein [Holophaga sp.]|nr:protease pro-enzyme activation domain-containing protein [Holophaga sp.]
MSRPGHLSFWTLLAVLPAFAGKVQPTEPIAVQPASAPAVVDSDYLELRGNVPPAFASARQLGPAEAQEPMDNMILALKLAPGAEARLARRLAEMQDSGSPSFHQWLTPEQFGAEFGPSQEALDQVTGWLQDNGFQLGEVAAGRLSVTFSGSVEQVERAFRTPIRRFELAGKLRQGNTRDPSIPRALAHVVEGVVSLHNVPRPAMNRGFTPAVEGSKEHELTPGDFAAIYNLKPLYQRDLDGSGVSVAIVGRTHIPLKDIATFRKEFGLPDRIPEIIINGTDPGNPDPQEDGEADLDVEWSGAVARNATIRFVASASTASTDGVDLSARYIVDHNLAPVMSTSFGQCESLMGSTERAFFRNLWAQAAVQGISSVVSSGDSGPAGCNQGSEDSGSGPEVSGLASTPFNLAVGGTQFHEGSGTYWQSRKNPDQSSAIGYIPEQAWNESGSAGGTGLWASGGGPSGFYLKPCWQIGLGVPEDAKYRSIPDVALAAAGGHDGYVVETGGMRTTVGGTSCSAPAFAGLLALVVQKTGERQGNPCPALYALGNAQFHGKGPQVFHDITAGDTTVPGTQGYACARGYDLATGLGSVDAEALVSAWNGGLGNNVEAVIRKPAGALTIANGGEVAFLGAGQESNPGAALSYTWDFGDGGSAKGAASSHAFHNAGPDLANRVVSFTATDGTGAQGSDTRTISVLPPTAPGEQILNGGFEGGELGWRVQNVVIGNNEPSTPARSGQGDAYFSGWQNGLPEVLQQTVRIPAQAASARLDFWLRIDIYGDDPRPLDCLQVKARGTSGKEVVLASYSNLDYRSGYRRHSLDLAAYRGQTVQLSFVAEDNPYGVNTCFTLDDVSLIAG